MNRPRLAIELASHKLRRYGDASRTQVEMAGDNVKCYRILGPCGPFTRKERQLVVLRGSPQRCGEDRAMLERLFVTAVDPCPGPDVRIH
jgi:hypothetical protein